MKFGNPKPGSKHNGQLEIGPKIRRAVPFSLQEPEL